MGTRGRGHHPPVDATTDPRDDPPREGPDVQPAELEGNEEWPRETGPADVEAGEEGAA